MKLKQYLECNESFFSWLDKVPPHWDMRKLRTMLKPCNRRNHPNLPLLSVVREKGIIKRNVENRDENYNYVPDDLSNYKVVKEGQFVINKMKSWQGSYGISPYDGIVSPAYYVFDCNNVCPDYFHIAIRSRAYVPFFSQASDGVRVGQWDLSITRMKEIPFAIPTEGEQKTIVAFIRSKEKKIAKFIRNKRRLIQLLKEQKQIIINQAMTRGIDPNVKMKPSGVDWLGDIPEHWEIRRLRTVAFVRPSGVDKNTNEGEVPVKLCNYVDVYKNERILHTMDFMNATATPDEITKFELKSGDVLITKDSEMWNDIAVPAFIPQNMPGVICAYHLAIIRPMNIDGEFLFRAFLAESVADQFRVSANGVTRYGLSQGAIKGAWFPIPPKEEQTKIVEYINQNLSKIYLAIEKSKREIELIREYRTSLISDVVTGKVDVRNIKVEDVAEKELLEDMPDAEETPAYAEASAGREELEDSLEDGK
ncbi:MAG: restriction endonuclease subunit S [Candidatus Scalindua sp.]